MIYTWLPDGSLMILRDSQDYVTASQIAQDELGGIVEEGSSGCSLVSASAVDE